jgi:Ca2+-binding RTX toxin-like protein
MGRVATVVGTEGPDVLTGSPADEVIHGLGGDDVIDVLDGNDYVCGGAGNDNLTNVGSLLGRFSGDEGDDAIRVSGHGDVSYEDAPNGVVLTHDPVGGGNVVTGWGRDEVHWCVDTLVGSRFDDVIDFSSRDAHACGGIDVSGLAGDDSLTGGAGEDNLDGGLGDDALYGHAEQDSLNGGPGDDLLDGGSGSDAVSYALSPAAIRPQVRRGLIQGWGLDRIRSIEEIGGSQHGEVMRAHGRQMSFSGGGGDDVLEGWPGLHGGPGDDRLRLTRPRSDTERGYPPKADGGPGRDTVVGSPQTDDLYGGSGPDLILAGPGRDQLEGQSGDDILFGHAGTDWLDGGSGRDRGDAGPGRDNCVRLEVKKRCP